MGREVDGGIDVFENGAKSVAVARFRESSKRKAKDWIGSLTALIAAAACYFHPCSLISPFSAGSIAKRSTPPSSTA